MRPPRREERPGGVAVDESVLDGHLKDGSQVEAEMIDDARTERLGLAVEQLLKSASIKLVDRLIADLVDDVSSDSVFRRDSGRELPPAPFERKVGPDDELAEHWRV